MTRREGKSYAKRWIIGTLIIVFVSAAGWGALCYRRNLAIAEALPKRMDLAKVAPELHERIGEMNQRAVDGPQRIAALGELSRLYHANGYLAEAGTCYRCLEQIEPNEARWKYRHALILSGFGEFKMAVSLLRRTIELKPDYLPARLRLGDILLKDNQIKEAVAVYEAAQAHEPGEPYSLLGLARCDMDQDLWSEALGKLERVVAATNYALGYDLIVPVYERLGMSDRAAAIRGRIKAWGAFRDMADPWIDELNSDCYDAYQLSVAAGALKVRGEREGSRTLIERAVQLSPKNAPLHFQLALLLMDFSEHAKAKHELELCTQLDPTFADGWAYLSGVLSTMGDSIGAQKVFTAGLEHCPESPGLRRMLANQLQAQGRIEDAIKQYRESIRFRPTEAEPYIELGMALLSANRTEEAIEEFNRALVAEPENPMVLSTLAFHAISIGDEAAARQWMARIHSQPRVLAEDVERLAVAFRQTFGRSP